MMMSIRLKVFLIITVIVVLITGSSVAVSIVSAQNQILETLERDMLLVTNLANEYISGEIDLLKANASSVAHRIKASESNEMMQVLIEQVAAYENFTTITIFNEAGKIEASYGPEPAPEEIVMGRYGSRAFEGLPAITTSHLDHLGNLVFHVFVPVDDYYYQSIIGEKAPNPKIVACTVPGHFFSERMSQFLIWDAGNIIIEDEEGTLIANVYHELVAEQVNFLELAQRDHRYQDAARVTRRMISGELGADRVMIENTDAVFAFMPITASEDGWSIGVIAPIAESPFYKVRLLIVIAGAISLCLGLAAAVLASGIIAQPSFFKQGIEGSG